MPRLLLTAAIIAAVGAALVVLNPDGEVDSSRADITALNFGPRTQTARFQDALTALGHGEPQALELNGNRIFVSSTKHQAAPLEVLRDYQREFVRQGLNDQMYTDLNIDSLMQRKRTALGGGVVPLKTGPSHVIMSGIDTVSGAQGPLELLEDFDPTKTPAETFSAYRWVEIHQAPGSSASTVMASWSDEDFDYSKMFPKGRGEAAKLVDSRVPVCPKCVLVNQLSDVGRSGTHRTYVFTTTHSRQQLAQFYRQQLTDKGWTFEKSQRALDELKGLLGGGLAKSEHYSFRRGALSLNLTIFPIEGRTHGVRAVLVDDEHNQSLNE